MNLRKYGKPPYRVAVIHGGPGAPGYMAPVARELSRGQGILEPLQTKDSLDGQIEELIGQLTASADGPVTLIGSSWGAVLALFVAARTKEIVKKLILIGSAVFDAESSSRIETIRIDRLSEDTRRRYCLIMEKMNRTSGSERGRLMDEWGKIIFDADVFDPLTRDLETLDCCLDIFENVWPEFTALRDRPGCLNSEFSKIKIPTIVIHGNYDPHPIEGIRPFLEDCIENIRFHILPDCGHYPWIERRAREQFFALLRREL